MSSIISRLGVRPGGQQKRNGRGGGPGEGCKTFKNREQNEILGKHGDQGSNVALNANLREMGNRLGGRGKKRHTETQTGQARRGDNEEAFRAS